VIAIAAAAAAGVLAALNGNNINDRDRIECE